MNNAAVLNITDGTTRFDLLKWIKMHAPSMAQPKETGSYEDSPFLDGRRTSFVRLGNAMDTFALFPSADSQDDLAADIISLRKLLMKIRQYNAYLTSTPVYMEARGTNESYMRYAVIYDWRIPGENSPFSDPVVNSPSAMANFELSLERGHWLAYAPGTGVCAQAGSEQVARGVVESDYEIQYTSDDGYMILTDPVMYTYKQFNELGLNSKNRTQHGGFRFINVDIPVGATILSAYLEMVPTATDSRTNTGYLIYGELTPSPATYSTSANYLARAQTVANVSWNNPACVAGVPIRTPAITTIIAEIAALATWTGRGSIAIQIRTSGLYATPDRTRKFASWENVTYAAPKLHIVYLDQGIIYGIKATCDGIYISNKHNRAQLTHVYHFDASTGGWSANLMSAALPTTLLPAVPAANDCVYFIIDTSLANTGPFWSLVLDLINGSGLVGVWEHLTNPVGPIFTNLGHTFDDTLGLTADGVHSVTWDNTDTRWVTGNVNGVTGWAVRFRITAVLDPIPPQQQNRKIFTAVTPFADVPAAQLPGDLPALAQLDMIGAASVNGSRVTVGSRRTSRGEEFSAYINIADEQNPTGVTATSGVAVVGDNKDAPSGRSYAHTPGAPTAWASIITVTIDELVAGQWFGAYHAFIRYNTNTAWTTTPPAYLQLVVRDSILGGPLKKSPIVACECGVGLGMVVADMGVVYIGAAGGGHLDSPEDINLYVYDKVLDAAAVVNLFDIVLIPTDEWAGDFYTTGPTFDYSYRLQAGSLRDFRKAAYAAMLRGEAADAKLGDYISVVNDRVQLMQGERQRLWFIMSEANSAIKKSNVDYLLKLKLTINPQYFSMRGRQ